MGGEGGAGAEGGAGGAGAEGGAGGTGGVEPDACVAACEALDACALTECEGADGMSLLRISEICAEGCAANDSFAAVSSGIASCSDRIAFARQNLPEEFGALCLDDGVPDQVPECVPFGERIVACMIEDRCPALQAVQALTTRSFTASCNGAVAAGQISPMDLATLINANTPCDSPFITGIIAEQIDGEDGPGGEPGPLGTFCTEGAVTDPAVCAAACEVVAPCIPEGSDGEALRDPAFCEYFCITNEALASEGWACAAEAGTCEAIGPCFEGAAPPPENCAGYSARVQACVTEACPPAAALGDGVASVVQAICDGGEIAAAVVDPVTAETPCEDPALAYFVTVFTQDDPENPDDGFIAAYCAGAPAGDAETCTAACAAVGPCVPPESDGAYLANADICRLVCVAGSEIPAEVWGCAAMASAEECVAVQACFPEDGE